MRKLEQRDTRAVFEQLEALGWLSQIDGPRPSSPPQWLVNPRVHEKFAERAKTEAERRKKVHAAIIDIAEEGMRFAESACSDRRTAAAHQSAVGHRPSRNLQT